MGVSIKKVSKTDIEAMGISHASLSEVTPDAHHNEGHSIVSHDTSATGAELDVLTDGSNADSLHGHEPVAPAGNNTEIQFNNGGAFGADIDLTWDNTAKIFSCDGVIVSAGTNGNTPVSGAGSRFMWIPAKSALRAGTVTGNQWDDGNIGQRSIALGLDARASSSNTLALGETANASGTEGIALGKGSLASGTQSIALGNASATQTETIAMGSGAVASASQAIAAGSGCISSGVQSFSCGFSNESSGEQAFSVGYSNEASGQASFCGGYNSEASELCAFSFGQAVLVDDEYGKAWGNLSHSRQYGLDVLALGRFENDGDAQFVKTVVRGEMEAYGDTTVSTNIDYAIPENFAIGFNLQIVVKANDNTCAFFNRMALVANNGGVLSVVGVQNIGVDIDPEPMIDELLISTDAGALIIEIVSDYDDDVGIVVGIHAVENGYTKTST